MSVLDLTLLAAVWGVNIQAFQQELHLSSSEIAQRYHDKTMFGGKYMEYQDLGQYPFCHHYLSHIIRKPVCAICEQQRRRSACASMQSDQCLVVRCLDSIIPLVSILND